MSGWSPPPPGRAPIEWQEPARGLPREPSRDAQPPVPPSAPAPRRRPRPPLRPPSPARLLALMIALAVGIAAVTAVGTAITPRYGDLPPYGTTAVADLRSKPMPEGWSIDLARAVVPGVPVRCVSFSSNQATGRDVVVTGSIPSLGSTAPCSQASLAQVQSTIALLDSTTGTVTWSTDLSKSFPSRSGSVQLDSEQVVPSAHRVVVELSVDDVTVIASLSASTGDVLSSTRLEPGASGDQPAISGRLVLYGGSVAREGATDWTLADVAHVDEPIWSGVVDDSNPPLLTAQAAFGVIDGRSSRIDGRTGRVTQLGDGTVDLGSALADARGILTSQTLRSGTVVTAWDDSGRALWTRSGIGTLAGLTRDCLMTDLPGASTGMCVDRDTGRERWRAEIATGSFAYSIPGQTTDQVLVYRNKGNLTELDFFDGATGRLLFPIELPPVSFTIISARTTGYLEVSSDSGSPTGITAFDAASGRQLWTLPEAETRDTEFWGGQLVRITADGIATQLVDRPRPVLGLGG